MSQPCAGLATPVTGSVHGRLGEPTRTMRRRPSPQITGSKAEPWKVYAGPATVGPVFSISRIAAEAVFGLLTVIFTGVTKNCVRLSGDVPVFELTKTLIL